MTREEIARVIDPDAWRKVDRLRRNADTSDQTSEKVRGIWRNEATDLAKPSLAKAYVILSKLHQDAGNGELIEELRRRAKRAHIPMDGLAMSKAADALERGSQVGDGLGRDVVDRLAEDAFNEGWRSREAILGALINSRGIMRRAWLDSNARDAIHAPADGGGG